MNDIVTKSAKEINELFLNKEISAKEIVDSFYKHIESVEPKIQVNPPIIRINFRVKGAYSIIGEHLIIKNTPAVTKVAACIKAETGVGPSIASGNQPCKPNCADLPIDPITNKIAITSK